ncbi:IclR family transcriptional regulator domain-containing protein [Chitinasiproducens palmae]|uniref:DNA-binding transcriptional regulator, IclR family n=1 Tax=Chitinasiproducens palmae TaxID=1770053 RepID=A0A1H2PLF0_9BURK|nr:IclR family transcriptional regulator C-terminal domain-containing protein [Chitinasiproducens palmae]SDV47312.1 DNA-binding transcriptional regulator, IclR family [Chitinasiproducens palmae]
MKIPQDGKNLGDGTGALEKALDVLDAIGNAPDGLSQARLAEAVPLPRTTLYRIVASLVARGMVRRDPVRKVYRLGFRFLELVRNAYLEPDLVASASFELRSLRDLSGETSYLAVLDGDQVLSLERCDGAHVTRSAAALGRSKPVYCTGQGKAILSSLDEKHRESILKGLTMTPLTPQTLTDRRQLQAELRATKARGYAIDDEEIVTGIRCVAAPIIDSNGLVRGALSVAGPAYRLTRQRLDLLGPEVAGAARRVGSQLAVHEPVRAEETIRPVTHDWAFVGKFPRWSGPRQGLFWADTLAPAVHFFDGERDRILTSASSPIIALELHEDGVIVAQAEGWSLVGVDGKAGALHAWHGAAPECLCLGPDGVLWGACHDADAYRIGPVDAEGGEASDVWRISEPISALAWHHDGTSLYALAPQSGTIFLMSPGSKVVRRFAQMAKGSGHLAGLVLDSRGGVWTTLKDGWSVAQFSASGNLERLMGVPVPSPVDIEFGGKDLSMLYLTSDRHALSRETLNSAPLSGHLLQMKVDETGAPRTASTLVDSASAR